MGANRTTPISGAASYREIGEYWDNHDLAEHPNGTDEVPMDVAIESSVTYFGLEKSLADKLRAIAHDHGVSPEKLLNRWVEEQIGNRPSGK